MSQLNVTVLTMSGKDLMLQHPFNRLLLLHSLQMKHILNQTLKEDVKFYQDVLINGIESEYNSIYDEISTNDATISIAVTDEVRDIIRMFEMIHHTLESHSHTIQQHGFMDDYIYSFNGFNGKNLDERAHFIYLRFLMNYHPFTLPIKDTNFLSLAQYRVMLGKYERYKHLKEMTIDQLEDICFTYSDINFPGIAVR